MEVIIIDSITHEWDGKGGILDIQNALGGRYQDWAKVTPRHQSFTDAILQSKCHMITTVRRKQDYEMTKDNGKTTVQKVGTKEITREGYEYELTVNFEFVNDKHLVKASKDRTGLFMDKPEFLIGEDTGKKILQWCLTGEDPAIAKNLLVAEYKNLLSNDEVFTADEQRQLAYKTNWTEERLERAVAFLKEKVAEKLEKV